LSVTPAHTRNLSPKQLIRLLAVEVHSSLHCPTVAKNSNRHDLIMLHLFQLLFADAKVSIMIAQHNKAATR
jgi:hypothetical protein